MDSLIESFNSMKSVEKIKILQMDGEAAFNDLFTLEKVGRLLGEAPYERPEKPREVVLSPDDPLIDELIETESWVSYSEPGFNNRTFLFPLFNEERCHRCHGSGDRFRGMVLISMSIEEDLAEIKMIKLKLALGFIAIMLILVFLLWFALNKMIVLPLKKIAQIAKSATDAGFPTETLDINSNDEIGELAGNFNRMTETLKENYLQIKNTESFLQTILGSLEEGIIVIDKNFSILMANQYTFNILKIKQADVIGQKCHRVIRGNEKRCDDCTAAETFKTRKPAFARHRSRREDNSIQTIEYTSYPIFDHDGNINQVIEMATDISERLEMEEKLRHSEKLAAVGQLASGLAHEVGNPLTSISYVAQIIERKTKEPFTKEKIGLMKAHIDRISKIVHDFLEFSKPMTSRFSRLDIQPVIKSAIQMSRYDKRVRKLKISTKFEQKLPRIFGSLEGLQQILLNLILNAADAIGEKEDGVLEISVLKEDGFVNILVHDNGVGMSRDEKEKIFDPFFTTKQPGKGMGLGLFVSYGIVKSFGGDITVDSEKGKGTTFNLKLKVI